ncbi:DUF4405 domain-containing protein [Mangrovibacterium diazotrophicum]|uniref:Uncharacterized protein DUF4405 n=1 Tax=Mangrovibacterium diazotrophicum TaxID=1261403 RepID=A0A419VVX6_9BACT|nr:DUF4405 domain-containing protein [Mangrovibacterium diazotrophicum]RKD86132.1 uncharacterized protein DUF4405 [Mangrovibacterium diazotrophicum]
MKNKFSWRAFISFGLTYSLIIVLVSGLVLYVSPPGRYAHWVNWKLLGATKEGWQAIHTIFSFAFVILSLLHLFSINWKAFLSYLRARTEKSHSKKRELVWSSVVVVIFFIGTVFSIPPFSSVMNLSENLTASWEKTEETPPVPHAELLTLAELDTQLPDLSLDQITEKLKRHNIAFENASTQTLREIAELNNQTPMEIYAQITQKPASQMQGSGIGRKSLETICTELNKNADDVILLLEDNAIIADKDQTLRAIGDENGISPKEIYDLINQPPN